MKYILYARKSEEDKNRQVQSIETQVQCLRELAEQKRLTVVEEVCEARTAKQPGRPLFDAMVERIQQGEADGILVWSINRLLRNPVDQGTIQWLLQTRKLKSILTPEKEHTPDDNVLILNVESGVANQFIIDLQKHTKRGMDAKVQKGWFPHRAPEGYLNDTSKEQGDRDITIDPVRFAMLRQAWEKMLTESVTVREIKGDLDRLGYRTKPHLKSRTGKISRSGLYRMFSNKFYAGYFVHRGVWYRGKHTPMVTEAEFNEVQRILGKEDHIAPHRHRFPYSGVIRCGNCGCMVVGEVREKVTKTGVSIYRYYHCSNSKGICRAVCVTEDYLENELMYRLPDVTIHPGYRDLILAVWRHYFTQKQKEDTLILSGQHADVVARRLERDRLIDLRLRDIIDDELFLEKKARLDSEIKRMEADANESTAVLDQRLEVIENIILFVTEPKDRFRKLSVEMKNTIALHLGARYILNDRQLSYDLSELLAPIAEVRTQFQDDLKAFELTKFSSGSTKKEAFEVLCSNWGPLWDRIRNVSIARQLYFPHIHFNTILTAKT